MAKLYFRYGAMNSGKSTALIQVAHNYKELGLHPIIMKPSTDTKSERVVSRLGVSAPVDYSVTPDENIVALFENILKEFRPDCVLVDEAQFLSPAQADGLFEIVVRFRVPVIAYGLRTDFKRDVFPGAARLLGLAHSVEELKTVCSCGAKALLNARTVNGVFVTEGDSIRIDRADDEELRYEGLCGACYFEKVLHVPL